MLRNRARAVPTKKQALMADHQRPNSTTQNNTTSSISSFLGSPRFRAFTTKGLFGEPENSCSSTMVLSPTSTLRTPNPITNPNSPFTDKTKTKTKTSEPVSENKAHSWDKLDSRGIGLAIIDKISDDPVGEIENCTKPRNRKVLFGSELRVQIPPPPSPPMESNGFGPTKNSGQVFTLSEMELSEDYTCVISHWPNPRTTHIFDNCIVESYSSDCCVLSENPNKNDDEIVSFFTSCHTCNKSLEHKNDIFIYRGDKAFCSEECRNQEMLLDGNGGFGI